MGRPFSFTPHIRVVPPGGPKVDYDLSAYAFVTMAQPIWEPIFIQKELITREIVSTKYGYRLSARLEFDFVPGSTEDSNFGTLINRTLMDETRVIEVTLDGVVYRECTLAEWTRIPLDGKNIGAHYSMLFVVRKLFNEFNALGPAPNAPAGPPVMTAW